ncbi:MAG TPA: Fe-S cluster assembly protein SufD [Nitrososphaerales archaeon]|nr:Fe-S cluster assembly protein SufD [Nitrososphaerales archaeon]
MSQRLAGAFSEDAVRSLSEFLKEPGWLTNLRLKAFGLYSALPTEKNALYTKYAEISRFDESRFGVVAQKSSVDLRSFFKDYLTGRENNIVLQGNETEVHAELEPEVAAAGVKLLTISEALEWNERLVKTVLSERLVKSEDDRYAAFTNAFFNSGTFIYVPKEVRVPKPLRKMLLLRDPTTSIVEQTVVYAEEGSRVVFLEELYSATKSPALVTSAVEVRANAGARVDFSSVQLLDQESVNLSNRALQAKNDSKVTFSSVSLGSSVSRSRTNFLLDGRGSEAEGFEIFFTDEKQRYDFETNLLHNSADSTGSTQARGVLKDESQSIFKGMIRIGPSSKNSRAYLAHHAMILDRRAKSDGIPGLDILTNEVKATHSASVAQIDEEQLFYLMARGLNADEAKRMVVLGFFEPVLSRVPIEQTREGARFMIEGKWEGERRRLVDRETLIALTGETTPEVQQTEDIFERHYKYRR